jgi:hypothetical protein
LAHSNCTNAWVLLAAFACAESAFAAHPLFSEDTGTQGTGNLEFENGLSWLRTGSSKTFTYQPQISYGASPTLDLIVQPSWLTTRDAGSASVKGLGDTTLDVKWRFSDVAPLSFAVRAGATLATSQHGLGLARSEVSSHVLLVTTYDAAPFAVHGNVGLTRNPNSTGERSRIGLLSGALTWAAAQQLTLAVDVGAQSSPDPTRSSWPGTLLIGAIYAVRPGLDIDVGYQSSAGALVNARAWLAGVTYRFAQ